MLEWKLNEHLCEQLQIHKYFGKSGILKIPEVSENAFLL